MTMSQTLDVPNYEFYYRSNNLGSKRIKGCKNIWISKGIESEPPSGSPLSLQPDGETFDILKRFDLTKFTV